MDEICLLFPTIPADHPEDVSLFYKPGPFNFNSQVPLQPKKTVLLDTAQGVGMIFQFQLETLYFIFYRVRAVHQLISIPQT